ncbi:MAG: GNAT family N-acetyltransferase [Verrucomicrobia bacterium]|nr:GNAT family N-acetyltransferase [Verrucomicrobiota bacterium]
MKAPEVNFSETKAGWDAFVATSPQRSIFVETRFLDSLLTGYDLVTCRDGGVIVAGAVIVHSPEGGARGKPQQFTQYQGLLLADNRGVKKHSALAHELGVVEYFLGQLTARYPRCCLCQSWRFADLRAFQWHNYHAPDQGMFRLDLRYTGIVDLKSHASFEDYLSCVRTVRRQEFGKASQALALQEGGDGEVFFDLYRKTFERQDLRVSEREGALVRSIVSRALEGGYGKRVFALLGGVPVAAAVFVYDDRSAYYLFGAADPAHRRTFAGAFVLLQLIKDAFARGLTEVDLVGVNSPNRGDFKISFNADIRPHFNCSFGS